MNRSFDLCGPHAIPHLTFDKAEAVEYLSREYPGIQYNAEDDSFTYRGIKFDYFQSGIVIMDGKRDHYYTLVDPKDPYQHWLFQYGDKEDRWKDYLNRCEIRKTIGKKKPSLLEKIRSVFIGD